MCFDCFDGFIGLHPAARFRREVISRWVSSSISGDIESGKSQFRVFNLCSETSFQLSSFSRFIHYLMESLTRLYWMNYLRTLLINREMCLSCNKSPRAPFWKKTFHSTLHTPSTARERQIYLERPRKRLISLLQGRSKSCQKCPRKLLKSFESSFHHIISEALRISIWAQMTNKAT